ncbi:hypothetical protein [Synechococcus sp. UW140]|uniref:hypothetical protein n=1 Tax=Synechococcus sp. UW140 TaxID=368503 RepID=UPI0031381EBF
MKSLLKFVTSEDRALEMIQICANKGYIIQHKTHQERLTESIIKEGGFSVDFGGYGSYSRLGLGNNFGTKWEVSGLDAPANKSFTSVNVSFGAGFNASKQKLIAEYIVKQGGLIVEEVEGDCDLFILADTTVDEQNRVEPKWFLTVGVDEFLEVIPAIKSPRPKAPKTAPLSEELKQLQKQLLERNHDSIRAALKALEGRDEEIDLLIQGVSVNSGTGELDRGPKFKGSGPALEFIDLSLAGLLSQAGENSQAAKIRSEIKKLKFEVKTLPRLSGFTALEDLEIILNRNKDDSETEQIADLSVFGELPKLRNLRIANEDHYANKSLLIKSLDGLKASLLEELEASDLGLESIAALSGCKQLKSINLRNNSDLSSIEALSGCSTIEVLQLDETGIVSLEPLSAATNLKKININCCEKLKSIKGLNAIQLESFELGGLNIASLDGIEYLTSIKELELASLYKLKNLTQLSKLDKLEKLELYHLKSLKELPEFEHLDGLRSVSIQSCDLLEDASSLATASGLKTVSIEGCKKLKSGPTKWPEGLQELTIQNSQLTELGVCPSTLTELEISFNESLKSLDSLSACSRLNFPYGIDLNGCYKLENIDGLNIQKLDAIRIPETLNKLEALKRYPDIAITVVAKLGKEIPEALGNALLAIAPTNLVFENYEGIAGISRITTLTTLDLSSCDLSDITGIIGLENLELLKIQPRTELSKSLGQATFEGKAQINKLRLKFLAGL